MKPIMSISFKRTTNSPIRNVYNFSVLSPPDNFEFSSALNGDLARSNEKEQLKGLNDRFASYIDKVRYLKVHNKHLEAEIRALRQQKQSQPNLSDAYNQQIQELRLIVEQLNREKAQILLDKDHANEDIQRLKKRYEEEWRLREQIESAIRKEKKDKDGSILVKSVLEKKVQVILDKIGFLRHNHEMEVKELLAKLQATQVPIKRRDMQKTDITSALREIRAQLDSLSSKNLQQVEDVFKCHYSALTGVAEQNENVIGAAREIAEYRRQLQTKHFELEALHDMKESLERQLSDIEDRHNSDIGCYQEKIHELKNDLKRSKWEMTHHRQEYQDQLNVKMALDAEIAAYRKLIEREETQFKTFSGTPSVGFTYNHSKTPRLQNKVVNNVIEEITGQNDIDDDLADVAKELSAEACGQEEEEIMLLTEAKLSTEEKEENEVREHKEGYEREEEVEPEEENDEAGIEKKEENDEDGDEQESESGEEVPEGEVIAETGLSSTKAELTGSEPEKVVKGKQDSSEKAEGKKKNEEEKG